MDQRWVEGEGRSGVLCHSQLPTIRPHPVKPHPKEMGRRLRCFGQTGYERNTRTLFVAVFSFLSLEIIKGFNEGEFFALRMERFHIPRC